MSKTELLSAVQSYLRQYVGGDCCVRSVVVVGSALDGDPVQLELINECAAHRSRVDAAIVAALGLATEPLKATALARRAGCACTSYFRSRLSALVQSGEIIRCGGYWLAGKPVAKQRCAKH